MKILVTGANGQLGREMRNVLETENPNNAIYTDINELDLTNANAINDFFKKNEISHVVNCAAYTAVDKAEEEKLECDAININAVKNIANAAYSVDAKIIHISTDYVFDGTAHRPYKESDKVNPISQYGTSKRKGETALLALAPESIIIRTSWLYSPYGKNFVKTMLRLGLEQSETKVVCDQIGTPTYALDLAKAIYKILTSHQWVEGIFHFSNEGACSWYDFAKSIHRIANVSECKIIPISTEDYQTMAKRPFYSILDKTRIKATYGIDIPYWEDSLFNCINRIINEK
ncbi:MAG: dTDP-4-dehydrorhamnose reductase [Bacteroidales bacterium]|nr:dTDP-4-dehydrorhamnose reductase [Bacteroidales bacterium]